MKFIVAPITDKLEKGPPLITMCALCSEDPRFCNFS